MNDFPEIFNEFSEARKNGFIKIKNLKETGKKIVGTFCAFTPYELIMAADAIPISLCGGSQEPISDAERDLPRNLCPLIKSSYGFGITNKCPYFYFSDMIVGETTCDGKKKMYEYLSKLKPMHIMQLPQTIDHDRSMELWSNEMLALKKSLENQLDVKITENDIKKAIQLRNEERRILKEFYELSTLCPPPITGLEMIKVLHGTEFTIDKKQQNKDIKKLINNIKEKYKNEKHKISENTPRILITGCPIGEATEKIVKLVEENGGIVVCFENCSGIKSKYRLVDENKNVIDALTENYLNIGCSCISPNDNRIDLLSKLIDQYKIDGVIDMILQACHTYNVETKRIKEFVTTKKEIPYMSLETDYSESDIGQLKTRISAFIEML
ncbi:double-cubane-cluster-containing anaerobic reductase [Haloimpatiens sp. FM7330]|uniref:double-cubane-cluster-containing anaerobic reductase n=1 Tax=Haloimpatiens sp. FM7330 TaxID=3298610 RepID=UPI00362A79FD